MRKVTEGNIKQLDKDQLKQYERKEKIKTTRFLDNYFDPFVHTKSWFPNGLYKLKKYYVCSDSGLAYNYDEKNEPLQKLDQQLRNEKYSGMRANTNNFMEFDCMKDNEYIITIEYCSNCVDHQTHQMHSAELYRTFATCLQKSLMLRFPFIKILLKPIDTNIFEDLHKCTEYVGQTKLIDNKFKEVRIGAFEVQLAYKKKDEKNPNVHVIHSKLKTSKWPNLKKLLDDLVSYLPLCNYELELFDKEQHEKEKMGQGEKMLNKERLQRIKTRVYKYSDPRLKFYSEQAKEKLVADYNQNKAQMTFNRLQTREEVTTTLLENSKGELLLELYSDDKGELKFSNLPLDSYLIEVLPSKNYEGFYFLFNPKKVNDDFTVKKIIGLNKQRNSQIEVHVIRFTDKEKLEAEHIPNAKVSLKLCQEDEDIFSDFESRVQLKEKKDGGIFEHFFVPGKYVVEVAKDGWELVSRHIRLCPGDNKINIELVPELSFKIRITVFNYEKYQSDEYEPVTNCFIKIFKQGKECRMEGITNADGQFEANVNKEDILTAVCSKPGYLPCQRTVIRNKLEERTSDCQEIVMMLVKESFIQKNDCTVIMTYSNSFSENFKPLLQFSDKSKLRIQITTFISKELH